MGSEALVYPALRADRIGRSHYHPYHFTDSFDKLRHHLPAAISVACYTDSVIDQPWNHQQPNVAASYMHSPYFPNGQDANHLPFPQAVSPYFVPNYDAETKLNDDMDVGSFSGDDDVEEYDSNAQLRSQQLNSDGTPKRPMNAFMIFARKRRPMVSSEQPTMRTGEISKILSKEWSEMNKEEKKFYLDQAKKLKDTFNTRWPDYVYRRRPNNSRKRRKAGGTSSVGPARSHDAWNNSDSHADPTDLNASGQSGDEARSHSTDAFPSPPSSHHNHTYHTPEIGQPVSLDRSPTLANTLSAYTTTLPPYIPHSFADGSVFDKFSQQGHSYGGNGDVYYGAPVPIEASFSTIHHNPKMESWRPCGSTPSGVVATTSSTTPPVPMTAITSQELHPRLAYQPHDQGNWSKEAGGDAQCYEAQPTIWGSNSSVPAHHAVDDRGSTHSFSPSLNLSGPNALGMDPYGNHKGQFGEDPCQPTYIEANHTNQGYHPSTALPSFRNEFSEPRDSKTFLESRHWTLRE
ncbi:HMG-box domain, partial [Rhizoctonia solani]